MMKMSAKKKGLIGLVVMVVLGLAVLFGSDKLYQRLDQVGENKETEVENNSNQQLVDGSYKVEDEDFDESGYKGVVNITVADGKVTELTWDNLDKDGKSKSQLSLDGEYVMSEDGLLWADQSKALADYVIKNQTLDTLNVTEEGKTDAVSGVSINIKGFINLVESALDQAKGKEQTSGSSKTEDFVLEDGKYTYEDIDFDSNGYKNTLTYTVSDGKITELIWDNVDQDGNLKSTLSLDGEYVMTEDGLPWAEQSKALCDYVLEHQSLEGLNLGEDGKTDAISGVSISISDFYNCVERAFR
ncbi:MAG TPA: hypothetical protein IAC41_12000 [Candidatus Merdenecus merdavium]|nr:hypothetical protein [Candidatus Merdenecus merdavium]